MEKSKFIFMIDAERHFNVIVRIVGMLNRQRVQVLELNTHLKSGEETLRIVLAVEQTRETVLKLSRKIEREVDVIEVNVFEQMPSKSSFDERAVMNDSHIFAAT